MNKTQANGGDQPAKRDRSPLTDLKVKALVRMTSSKTVAHHDGAGLYLIVDKRSQRASWAFRYSFEGKARMLGLGPYPTIKLADARRKAEEARRLKAWGRDPLAVKDAERLARKAEAARAITFRTVAEEFVMSNRAGWSNAKHAAQWTSTLHTYVYPLMGDEIVSAVDTERVLGVLRQQVKMGKATKPLWEAKTETASRVRGRIEAILDYAKMRKLREGDNPAAWRGNLKLALPARSRIAKVKHHEAHPVEGMAQFMSELGLQPGLAARGLEFAILTAARTGEVLGATWAEIDLENKVWIIPSPRMKAGREHRVPLSDRGTEILKRLRPAVIDASTFVFPGTRPGKPLSNMAFLMLLRRMDLGDLTAHGFRSTFRDWVSEKTSWPSELAERALAHVVADKSEAAYFRGDMFDKRRALMQDWSDFCAGVG